MEKEIENNFSQFKNIFSVFWKKPESNNDYARISSQVSELISTGMFPIVFQYVHSGYKLNPSQKEDFYAGLNAMHYTNRLQLFSDIIKKGMSISDDLLLNQFSSLMLAKSYYDRYDDKVKEKYEAKVFVEFAIKRLPYLNTDKLYDKLVNSIEEVYNIVKNPMKLKIYLTNDKFHEHILTNIVEPIKNYGEFLLQNKSLPEVLQYMQKVKNTSEIFEKNKQKEKAGNISVRKWNKRNVVQTTYNGLNDCVYVLKQIPEKHYQNEIQNDMKQISILYSETEIDNLIAQENINFNKNNNIKDLPKVAQDILNEIKNAYLQLNKHINDLNDEEKFDLENLWTKRVPEIINKYLRADPEFRATMKNNRNETIEDLLIDSLGNIHDKLQDINKNHSQNILTDMSVLNRYTKAIKM